MREFVSLIFSNSLPYDRSDRCTTDGLIDRLYETPCTIERLSNSHNNCKTLIYDYTRRRITIQDFVLFWSKTLSEQLILSSSLLHFSQKCTRIQKGEVARQHSRFELANKKKHVVCLAFTRRPRSRVHGKLRSHATRIRTRNVAGWVPHLVVGRRVDCWSLLHNGTCAQREQVVPLHSRRGSPTTSSSSWWTFHERVDRHFKQRILTLDGKVWERCRCFGQLALIAWDIQERGCLWRLLNILRWNDVCHARREFFENCNIFSVLSIFKYNLKGKPNNKFITPW